ncbi:MAG TPA: anti-sigma factor [Ilumatobacteraceae bacterium]|nr:anti-sigma factor [Ilumatobacteraceae bacterium]
MEEQDDMAAPPGDTYELDELLGAYALDAVDEAERRRVEDYLEVNPRAAAEVQAHREVATMLAFTGMEAPDDLWSRIADEIGEQAPPPGPELAKVMSMEDHPRRRRISAIAPWVVTAAAAAVIGFVAIGLVDSAEAPNEPMSSALEAALADRDSLTTTLLSDASDASAEAVIDQDGHGFVVGSSLPTLPDGQTYQLWGVVEDGQVISLGIFGPSPEIETFTVEGAVTALAITIEQSPGVISNGNPDGAFVGAF